MVRRRSAIHVALNPLRAAVFRRMREVGQILLLRRDTAGGWTGAKPSAMIAIQFFGHRFGGQDLQQFAAMRVFAVIP